MLNPIKKIYAKKYDAIVHKFRVLLYGKLVKQIGDSSNAKRLSAQVVNYLSGTDFLNQPDVNPELINHATQTGLRLLNDDSRLRRIVVEINKGYIDVQTWIDKGYSVKNEYENVKEILNLYCDEFPEKFELNKLEKYITAYFK